MKKMVRTISLILTMAYLIGLFPIFSVPVMAVNNKFIEDPNWIESNPTEIDRMYNNNESFVVMYYGTSCFNSNLRKALVLSWLQDYGIKVYGVNNDIYSINNWVWSRISGQSVQLPIFAVVKSKSQYEVFPYNSDFLPLQESLFNLFGVKIKPVFDFYAINKATYDGYTSNSTYARGNFLPSLSTISSSIITMANEITAGKTNDYDKLRAIHDWVAKNIYYDKVLQTTGVGYVDAVNVLKYRRSVCEGYSNLTAALCHAVGIPSRVVAGMVLDGGLTEVNLSRFMALYDEYQKSGLTQSMLDTLATITNHAWNEAFVNNRWIILDTTYDTFNTYDSSGFKNGTQRSDYFDPSIEFFSKSHFFCRGDKYYSSLDPGTVPEITTASLPSGTVGNSYMASLSASGSPTIIIKLASGSLPTGLNLLSNGNIMGTPTTAGTYNFTVQASNSAGNVTKQFNIIIAPAEKPNITTSSLTTGTCGEAYSTKLSATGLTPITWSRTTGSLPSGLTLSSTGAITGTPTVAGTYNFTIQASNSVGNTTKQFTITVAPTSTELYQYLLKNNPDSLFGSYNFVMTYINDVHWTTILGYGAVNASDIWKSIVYCYYSGTDPDIISNIAENYMNDFLKVEAILREVINKMCGNEDFKIFLAKIKVHLTPTLRFLL